MRAKISIVGVECTGKTTLCRALAEHYACPWVPEYARAYLSEKTTPYTPKDILHIARQQWRNETQAWKNTKHLLICDTNLLTLKIWYEAKYDTRCPWIDQHWRRSRYTHYFLTQTDVPWVYDPLRESPNPREREQLHARYEQHLMAKTAAAHLTRLAGDANIRLHTATSVIDDLLSDARIERLGL